MQSVTRSFGKLWSKGPGDNAKFSVLLSDYEDADKVLAQIIDNAKLWRDAWASLVTSQLQIVTEYEGLYDPIVGASDGHGREMAETPRVQLERTFRLKEAYTELKTELIDEITTIEDRIVKPAADARDCIAPIRKTIKKRENKRLDYEKMQDKVNKLQRKAGRSPKEDANLAKLEDEMSRAADEFGIADEHLRETLPPIINATFSMVPPLLSNLVQIQNRLLGLYYTTLHNYCEDFGFPSPPPPMSEVVEAWNAAFKKTQSHVESISFIARGKAAHQPMGGTNDPQSRKPSASGPPSKPVIGRASTGLISSTNNGPQQRVQRVPSMNSLRTPNQDPSPQPSPSSTFKRPDYLAPTDFTTATVLGGTPVDRTKPDWTPGASPNSLRPRNGDYFNSRDKRPSTASTEASVASFTSNASQNTVGSYGGNNGFVKKKPPPPPPPKRIPSAKPDEYVVALYAFAGQGEGDLSFQEGDKIKIVKKTGTDQDWWVGELNGKKGNFPANYCKAT
ncbi:hypothetical protein B0H63DRAFT_287312 [Podospora didyma]|uniref:Regulator of cytoskeleton and endocytosis n=1 Tax=Podospora didyma TaxID=330526 RepID=A0AAE0K8C4_9PEZI|nr:hypothetical protein B0H63DRAFT_287312 [Podospora didyma]